ncbi:unnamed protein product [Vitrella brassicaformis CCMP3155]|uniref:Protein kinase domain-containing protein n=1 Tax=Vitrella brassicaformis (strain CCMP3155) TaxID=1169540 RepID=A0A0G4GIA6_VITBC|nr:unnamed protein product [Vitrella brassicaformis CCMP3155]|eukprot:CEM29575.1 unnamed protein product [Vitrella brassicaformis CCMP3155]
MDRYIAVLEQQLKAFTYSARGGLAAIYFAPAAAQILLAVDHLHKQEICHNDIKPLNFFIGDDERLVLADFGCAMEAGDCFFRGLRGGGGTLAYSAPESLRPVYNYGLQADMWSVGATLLQMATKRLPFSGANEEELKENVSSFNLDWWAMRVLESMCAPELQDLITKLLVKEPEQRLTAAQALQHPFVADVLRAIPWAHQRPDKPSQRPKERGEWVKYPGKAAIPPLDDLRRREQSTWRRNWAGGSIRDAAPRVDTGLHDRQPPRRKTAPRAASYLRKRELIRRGHGGLRHMAAYILYSKALTFSSQRRHQGSQRKMASLAQDMVVHNIMTHLAISRLAQPPSPPDPLTTTAAEQQQQHAHAGVMDDNTAGFFRELAAIMVRPGGHGQPVLRHTYSLCPTTPQLGKGDDPLGFVKSEEIAAYILYLSDGFASNAPLHIVSHPINRLGNDDTTTAIEVCEADEVLPPDHAVIMPLFPPDPPTSNSVLPLLDQRKPLLMQQHNLHTEEEWAAWRAEKANKSGLYFGDTGDVCRALQVVGVEGVEQKVARVVMIKDMFDKFMMMRETRVPVVDSEYRSALSSATAEEDILAAGMERARGDSSGATFLCGDLTPSNALVAISRYELQLKAGGTGRFVLPSVVFIDPSGTSRGTISALSGKTSYETLENKLLAELPKKLSEGVDWGDVAGSGLLEYGGADGGEDFDSGGVDSGEDFWSATKSAMDALHPPGVSWYPKDRPKQQSKDLQRMKKLGKATEYERIYKEELLKAKWPETLLLCAKGIDSLAACHAKADEILGTLRDRHVQSSLVDLVEGWRKEGVQVERLVGMVSDKIISLLQAATAIIYTHTSARADERGEEVRAQRVESVQVETVVKMVNERKISLLAAATATIFVQTSVRPKERGEGGRMPLISDQLGSCCGGAMPCPLSCPPAQPPLARTQQSSLTGMATLSSSPPPTQQQPCRSKQTSSLCKTR